MSIYSVRRTVQTEVYEWVTVEADGIKEAREKATDSALEVVHSEPGFSTILEVTIEEIEEDFLD